MKHQERFEMLQVALLIYKEQDDYPPDYDPDIRYGARINALEGIKKICDKFLSHHAKELEETRTKYLKADNKHFRSVTKKLKYYEDDHRKMLEEIKQLAAQIEKDKKIIDEANTIILKQTTAINNNIEDMRRMQAEIELNKKQLASHKNTVGLLRSSESKNARLEHQLAEKNRQILASQNACLKAEISEKNRQIAELRAEIDRLKKENEFHLTNNQNLQLKKDEARA